MDYMDSAAAIEDRIEQWFESRTVRRGECRVWTGHKHSQRADQPVAKFDGAYVNPRRVIFNEMVSLLGFDEAVVTTCGTLFCVTPDHLDAVPSKRGVAGRLANERKHRHATSN